MGMDGEYFRVTTDELARAIKDPKWALDHIETVIEAEYDAEPEPSQARQLTTHKAWHAIDFLLKRADFPVDIVYGEQPLTDEDSGYGPPKYLDADRVASAAAALAGITYDDLTRGVDPAELTAAEVYPKVWDEPDALEWVRGWYEPIVPYFQAAARDGQAMLIWLD